jgi:hypothetical protein
MLVKFGAEQVPPTRLILMRFGKNWGRFGIKWGQNLK